MVLMVTVNIGRYLERLDGESSFNLCNQYVATLGNQLEVEKQKNRELIDGLSPVEIAKGGDDG